MCMPSIKVAVIFNALQYRLNLWAHTPEEWLFYGACSYSHPARFMCFRSLQTQQLRNNSPTEENEKNECNLSAQGPSKRGRPGVDTKRCSLLSCAQLGCEVSSRQRGKNSRQFIWIFCCTAQTVPRRAEIPVSMVCHDCQLPDFM